MSDPIEVRHCVGVFEHNKGGTARYVPVQPKTCRNADILYRAGFYIVECSPDRKKLMFFIHNAREPITPSSTMGVDYSEANESEALDTLIEQAYKLLILGEVE